MTRRAGLGAIALALALAACGRDGGGEPLSVVSLLGEGDSQGYARAAPVPVFDFPADHGPHPDFRSEWWYFTGNLADARGRAFGFQLTFFRFALAPDEREGASAWGTRQVWMGHFAVTDVDGGRFHRSETFQRGALELAGARGAPFRAWVGEWEAASTGPALFPMRLEADAGHFALGLGLDAAKPIVFQGEDGYSAKGPEPGNASLYYAFTRLSAEGSIRLGGETFDVRGDAWLDREWSTSALGEGVQGWDWLSLQLDDGRELMLYRLRREDGSSTPFSAGSIVDRDGRVTRLAADAFEMRPGRRWRSPETGASYPVAWTVRVPSASLSLEVDAAVDGQEMNLSVRYWEGTVRARGDGVSGRGYLEMTGY
jgi:predicted secreted hydrolase